MNGDSEKRSWLRLVLMLRCAFVLLGVGAFVLAAIGYPLPPIPSRFGYVDEESREQFEQALKAWTAHGGWRYSSDDAVWVFAAMGLFAAAVPRNWEREGWKTWWIVGPQLLLPSFVVAAMPTVLGLPESNYLKGELAFEDSWMVGAGMATAIYVIGGVGMTVAHRIKMWRSVHVRKVRKSLDRPAVARERALEDATTPRIEDMTITGALGVITRTEYAGAEVIVSTSHLPGDTAVLGCFVDIPLDDEPRWFDGHVFRRRQFVDSDGADDFFDLVTKVFGVEWSIDPASVGQARARAFGLSTESLWPLDWHQTGMAGLVRRPGKYEGALVYVEPADAPPEWADIEYVVYVEPERITIADEGVEVRSGTSGRWNYVDGDDLGWLNNLSEALDIVWTTDPTLIERGRHL